MAEKRYTVNDERHCVFEEKHAKIKSFCFNFIVLFPLLLIALAVRTGLRHKYDDIQDFLVLVLSTAVVAAFLALYRATQAKNYNIVITADQIDVTIGKKHGVYNVIDFEGITNQYSNSEKKRSMDLVFDNQDEGDDEILLIDVSGIPGRVVHKIADKIFERQDDGTEGYEPLTESVYTCVPDEHSIRLLKRMMIIFIVMIAAGACFILMMLYFLKSLGVLLYFLVALESVGVIVGVITIFFLKKDIRRFLKTLSYNDTELKINEDTILVDNISEVKMTRPNEKGYEPCALKFKFKDSGKSVRYNVSRKLLRGGFERDRSAGCSSEYPCLYLAIKDLCSRHGIRFNP